MRRFILGIQWAVFILAGSIAAPLSIGAAFSLPINEIGELMQRTLFVIGAGTLLQVFFGHKLQIPEGAAGLWWGVFLIFAGVAPGLQGGVYGTLRSLQLGLMASGIIFIVLGLTKTVSLVKKLFTPIVTGTYLLLLVFQLSASFIKGMLGIGYMQPQLDVKVSLLSLVTLAASFIMLRSRRKQVRSYAVLYAVIFGWLLFTVFGAGGSKPASYGRLFSFPSVIAWGMPEIDAGVLAVSAITSLLLLSNLIASIDVVGKVVNTFGEADYNRSSLLMGANHILSGLFATTGFVPVSSSAGFIETTGIREKSPFIVGSALILCMSFFPPVTSFFTLLPVPVAYAATFPAFANMIGIGLKEYRSSEMNENSMFVIGASLMAGTGAMFIPSSALEHLPGLLKTLLNNGLIIGVLICILLEQWVRFTSRRKGGL